MVTTPAVRGHDDTESCAFSMQHAAATQEKEETDGARGAGCGAGGPTRRRGNSPPKFAEPPAISAIVTICKRRRFDEALDVLPEEHRRQINGCRGRWV